MEILFLIGFIVLWMFYKIIMKYLFKFILVSLLLMYIWNSGIVNTNNALKVVNTAKDLQGKAMEQWQQVKSTPMGIQKYVGNPFDRFCEPGVKIIGIKIIGNIVGNTFCVQECVLKYNAANQEAIQTGKKCIQ